jgi:RND family efflux transporter MFP subunit
MFSIARDDVLRVAVYVPQSGAIGIHDGLAARITVPEMPGRVFTGRVARSAVALQAASRSMLTEVDVANKDGLLRPGLYVDVALAIPRSAPGVVVPDEALVFNAAGLQVAQVQPDNTAHFRKVTVYRDFGTSAELREGLDGGETLILSPPSELADGSPVDVSKPAPEPVTTKQSVSR